MLSVGWDIDGVMYCELKSQPYHYKKYCNQLERFKKALFH
jgi:hypothetical protein